MQTEMGTEAEVSGFPGKGKVAGESESEMEVGEKSKGTHIPLHRWIMHGAVMFGREFCYAMENALVMPVLQQIGLPKKYYSLTWLLSPLLGLIISPWIGSASDRCTLKWGRRRPFILGLSVGVLLGVALFLNGSLLGLSMGDKPGSQTIGIVLTVVGVVVLDFSADALEGPIRAYLLDVADTEEQDIALNSHAVSGGLGGAVGYVMGGQDWTGTTLGQEQVLFLFASIVFIISVTLHMHSISEQPFTPSNKLRVSGSTVSSGHSSLGPIGPTPPSLDVIAVEDDVFAPLAQRDNRPALEFSSRSEESHMETQQVRSPPFPSVSVYVRASPLSQQVEATCSNDGLSSSAHSNVKKAHASTRLTLSQPRPPILYRIPSFTLSSFRPGGSVRYPKRRASQPIRNSLSLNDLSDVQRCSGRETWQLSAIRLPADGLDTEGGPDTGTTVRMLWLSMLRMPKQLLRLCLCHLITWFSIIAVAVFYTDFMGQVVYHGDPRAPANSTELHNYKRGVQMGCWGMVVYAATTAVCSSMLQVFLAKFDLSVKVIYMVGTLGFSIGTIVIAIFPNVYVAIVMISSMGVISMSISYSPYVLLGQYHAIEEYVVQSPENTRRGFGIDCAILSCQVYVSQILIASVLGAVVEAVGSVRVIPVVASGSSFLGFLAACFLVIYPDDGVVQLLRAGTGPGGLPRAGDSDPNGEKTNGQTSSAKPCRWK